jgi:hypothetical protein
MAARSTGYVRISRGFGLVRFQVQEFVPKLGWVSCLAISVRTKKVECKILSRTTAMSSVELKLFDHAIGVPSSGGYHRSIRKMNIYLCHLTGSHPPNSKEYIPSKRVVNDETKKKYKKNQDLPTVSWPTDTESPWRRPNRVTTQQAATGEARRSKVFTPELTCGEGTHTGACKRVTTPAGIDVDGAKALSFRPEKTLERRSILQTTHYLRDRPPKHDLGVVFHEAPPTSGSPATRSSPFPWLKSKALTIAMSLIEEAPF